MAYKGGVPVNSGFYPRNDFPIVDAKDIYVSEGKRLNVKLDELSTKIGNVPEDTDIASMIGNPKNGDTEATGLYKLIDEKTEFSGSYNDLTDLPTDHVTTTQLNTAVDEINLVIGDIPEDTSIASMIGNAKNGDTEATGLYKLIDEKANAGDLDELSKEVGNAKNGDTEATGLYKLIDEKANAGDLDELSIKIGDIPEDTSIASMIGSPKTDNSEATGLYALIDEKAKASDLDELSNEVGNAKATDDEGNVTSEATGLYALIDEKASISELHTLIDELKVRLDELEYKPITATLNNNIGTVEIGSKVKSVTLTWTTSKTPTTLALDGVTLQDVNLKTHTYDYSDTNNDGVSDETDGLSSTKSYKLVVTDNKGARVEKTTSVNFYNRICNGVKAMPANGVDGINSAFVMSLANKTLSNSKANNGINYNAGENYYIWYCVPKRLGTCSFTDTETGLGAGLSLVATIEVTNSSNYTEDYYVYRSDFAGLGNVTVKVS